MARRPPYPVERLPHGGIRKFRGTIQQSDDLPESLVFGGVGSAGVSTEVSRKDHVHPLATAASGTHFWICPNTLIATPGNPTANPWAFFIKIWLPFAQALHGYIYTLTRTGIKTDGALRFGIWTNVESDGADVPSAEYTAGRVLALHDEKVAGVVRSPLQSLGVTLVTLTAGYHWIHCCVDEHAGFGHLEPPIVWADGDMFGTGFSHAVSIPGMAGWVAVPWDSGSDVPQRYVPMVGIY